MKQWTLIKDGEKLVAAHVTQDILSIKFSKTHIVLRLATESLGADYTGKDMKVEESDSLYPAPEDTEDTKKSDPKTTEDYLRAIEEYRDKHSKMFPPPPPCYPISPWRDPNYPSVVTYCSFSCPE